MYSDICFFARCNLTRAGSVFYNNLIICNYVTIFSVYTFVFFTDITCQQKKYYLRTCLTPEVFVTTNEIITKDVPKLLSDLSKQRQQKSKIYQTKSSGFLHVIYFLINGICIVGFLCILKYLLAWVGGPINPYQVRKVSKNSTYILDLDSDS